MVAEAVMETTGTPVLLFATLAGCGRPTPPSVSVQDAARTGNLAAIRQHIKAGSNLNEKEPVGGSSPLNTAAAVGQLEVARALIQGGADVNGRNNNGETPPITPAFLCRTEIVQALAGPWC
jgi:hypothetical protein